jgi:signal transduction histidine kinase
MLGKNLTLTISDDGKGGVKEKSDSFGIRNIRDRARILNGKAEWKKPLEFETGTMLSLQIPIASLQEKPVISQAK